MVVNASEFVDTPTLRTLLKEIQEEHCAHSWKKAPVCTTPQDLLDWENAKRPTTIQYYYGPAPDGGGSVLVAAASVANAISHHTSISGFPVLARCYIRPPFRGKGLYRNILCHRLLSLIEQSGDTLKAVHMGTADARVARTIGDRSLPWNGFVQIGWEDLSIGAETVRVGGYLLFSPQYAQELLQASSRIPSPAGGISMRDIFESLLNGRWTGPGDAYSQITRAYSDATKIDKTAINSSVSELLSFCDSIPLICFRDESELDPADMKSEPLVFQEAL